MPLSARQSALRSEKKDLSVICLLACSPTVQDLGAASCTKRPTSCMLVLSKPVKPVKDDDEEKFKEAYSSVLEKVKASQLVF